MKPLPGLARLQVSVLNESIQVQAIILQPHRTIEALIFDHSAKSDIFAAIDRSCLPIHLIALIYEIPGNETAVSKMDTIEKALVNEIGENLVGIFHEPSNNYANLYLMAHKNDQTGFGSCFKGAKIGVFQFSYQDLLGENHQSYLQYIHSLVKSNRIQGKLFKKISIESQSLTSSIEDLNASMDVSTVKNNKLQKKIVTAKKIIKKKFALLNECSVDDRLSCIVCRSSKKNVLFLPCGHINMCKDCFALKMKIPIDGIRAIKKFQCLNCGKMVSETKEVFY